MQSLIDKLLERLNLSSPLYFFLTLAGCVLITSVLSDMISTSTLKVTAPLAMDMYELELRGQVYISTFILASVFFSVLLYLLNYVNEMKNALSRQVRYDSLTGLLTREAFLGDFKKQKVEKNNDAFLIIDADFFKTINDTHGHLAGDRALVTITEALKSGIRKIDTIGRIGGEEFAVHLKSVNYQLAVDIAERLRKNVKAANETFDLDDVDLSVSIGAVIYKEKIDLPTLMTKADRLLYKAKEKGRNRVEHNRINNEAIA